MDLYGLHAAFSKINSQKYDRLRVPFTKITDEKSEKYDL